MAAFTGNGAARLADRRGESDLSSGEIMGNRQSFDLFTAAGRRAARDDRWGHWSWDWIWMDTFGRHLCRILPHRPMPFDAQFPGSRICRRCHAVLSHEEGELYHGMALDDLRFLAQRIDPNASVVMLTKHHVRIRRSGGEAVFDLESVRELVRSQDDAFNQAKTWIES